MTNFEGIVVFLFLFVLACCVARLFDRINDLENRP
jgi:hypothetical protein